MPRRGMTLIEILLALAIFAVLIAVSCAALIQSLSTRAAVEAGGEELRLAAALAGRIEADAREAVFLGPDPSCFLATLTPNGPFQDRRLDLVTLQDSAPDAQGRSADLCEAGYLCRTEDGLRWKLFRREQPHADDKPTQGGTYQLMTDRLSSLTLEYSLDGTNWSETYDAGTAGRLPWLVRLRLQLLAPEGEESYPPAPLERVFPLTAFGLAPDGQ